MFLIKRRTMFRSITVIVVLSSVFLTSIIFSSCERIQHVIPPEDSATVKIGFIYSPPDPGTTRNGAELAVDLANQTDGINGIPVELLIRDDKKDASLSVQHANELVAEGISAILGPDYSTLAIAVAPIIQQHRIPMVTTYPTNPKVPESGNYIFMTAFIDPYQASIMADFAIQELGAITAAVLTEKGVAYSKGLANAFIQDFEAQGGSIATHQSYSTGAVDYSEQLTAIAAIDPAVDVVFLAGLGSEFPLAVKQAKSTEFNISATFLGGDGWDRPDLVEIGGMAVEGSYFTNHFSSGGQLSEDTRQFVNAYTEKYGIMPDGPAALGYDAATILVEAMRRAHTTTPEIIRDQIEATQDYSGATMLSHFDENRQPIKSLVINTVKDGRIQFHKFIAPNERKFIGEELN